MTRQEAIEKIKKRLQEDGATPSEVEGALGPKTPMWGSFLMLEALDLIRFDDK